MLKTIKKFRNGGGDHGKDHHQTQNKGSVADPDPHGRGKPDPDPHKTETSDPDPLKVISRIRTDLYQSQKLGAVEAHNGAL